MSEGRSAAVNAVSAVIITYNEEAKIGRCLDSLTWADEIVVVDAKSSDATPRICQDSSRAWAGKVKFFSREWSGFRDQRNFSIAQAKNDWLLVVDADEACSEELASRIKNLLSDSKGPPHSAYKVRRIEYFLGKPIHFGIWNPSYQDRFFRRDGVQYVNEIHEYPVFKNPPHEINEALHHAPDFSIEKFLKKMNEYTSLEAKARLKEGQRTSVFKMFFAFPAMFLKNYFYYSAYKDGVHGFVISLLEGVSRVVRHVKMWQYERDQNR